MPAVIGFRMTLSADYIGANAIGVKRRLSALTSSA